MNADLLQVLGGIAGGGVLVKALDFLTIKDTNKLNGEKAMQAQIFEYSQLMTREVNQVRKDYNEMHAHTLKLQKELFEFERKYLLMEDERNEYKQKYEEIMVKYDKVIKDLEDMKATTRALENKVDANRAAVVDLATQ